MQQVAVDREEYKKFILSEIELGAKIIHIHYMKLQEMRQQSFLRKIFESRQYRVIQENLNTFSLMRISYMDLYFFEKLHDETQESTIKLNQESPFLVNGRKSIIQTVYNNYYGES